MKQKRKANILPIGLLMIEHRLIERMVALFKKEGEKLEADKTIDADFLGAGVDFFKFYADRCHHGKEEDFLFKGLKKKQLTSEHKNMLAGLLQDHARARELVEALDRARQRYLRQGDYAGADTQEYIKKLVELYTGHIQKEDKQFFFPAMKYFTKKEQQAMLDQFEEFDKMLIHEKYRKLIEKMEGGVF